MGKIFIKERLGYGSLSTGPRGINFLHLSQMLNSLQGESHLLRAASDPQDPYTLLIEAENPNFSDGTEIVGKWITTTGPTGSLITTFNGVTVIDPPQQAAQQYAVTTGNGWLRYSVPGGGGGGGGGGGSIPSIHNAPVKFTIGHTDDIDTKENLSKACVCGAGSVGGNHSSYCPKF